MNKIPVIFGATASGKTAFAIRLAKSLHAEIISADSRQIYSELTIGTAKPSPEELLEIKHHFINERSIIEPFDAAQFASSAWERINEIQARGKNVIIVGGSTLYLKSLIDGFSLLPSSDEDLRVRLYEQLKREGSEKLFARLVALDAEHAKTLDHTKTQRLIRSLEVIELSGKKISELRASTLQKSPFRFNLIGLEHPREVLYNRINLRVDDMIKNGFHEEAKNLYTKFGELHRAKKINALETVGYKEFFEFFDHRFSLHQAINLIKQHTRNYAKRQLTFFKNQFNANWISEENFTPVLDEMLS